MSDAADSPLGVFDSGVGGLTVLQALVRALPTEDFLYLGDTARVPYGSKPLAMVERFAREIAEELISRGVKGIVVACNTASAASLPSLAETLPVPVWGVIEPGVAAVARHYRGGRVGVLATAATLRSGVYQARLADTGIRSWSRACPLFVPIVEEGISDSIIAELVARHYLDDRPELESAVLGCTHYPCLAPTLRRVVGDSVILIDSASETASTVAQALADLDLRTRRSRRGRVSHLVTGDVDTFVHTARILGGPEGDVERLPLPLPQGERRIVQPVA